MGYGSPDPYYQPEAFGLTPLAEVSKEPDYDFDIVIVWRHDDGTLYWAADSGCSCPSPFEEYHSLEDLHRLPDTMEDLRGAVDRLYGVTDYDKQMFWNKVAG